MRALRTLLTLVVVLGGLFAVADRLAVGFAEDEAAARIANGRGLTERPAVEIHGFPFLTQVARRELESVDASMDGLTVMVGGREVRVAGVDVRLHDVGLAGDFSPAAAGRATGTVRLGYGDLDEAVGEGLAFEYAGAERAARNQVRIGTRLALADVTLHSTLSVEDGSTIGLRAEDVPDLPLAEDVLRERLDLELEVAGLPPGLELERVRAEEEGVVLHLAGTDVRIAGRP